MFGKKANIITLKADSRVIAVVEADKKILRYGFKFAKDFSDRTKLNSQLVPENILSFNYYSPLMPRGLFRKAKPLEIVPTSGGILSVSQMRLKDYFFLEEVVANAETENGILECAKAFGEGMQKVAKKFPETCAVTLTIMENAWDDILLNIGSVKRRVSEEEYDKARGIIIDYERHYEEGHSYSLVALVNSLTCEGRVRGYYQFINLLKKYASEFGLMELDYFRGHINDLLKKRIPLWKAKIWPYLSNTAFLFRQFVSYLSSHAEEKYGSPHELETIVSRAVAQSDPFGRRAKKVSVTKVAEEAP